MTSEKLAVRLNMIDVQYLDVIHAHVLDTTRFASRSDAVRWALHHFAGCIVRAKRAGDGQCCALMAGGPVPGSNPTQTECASAREQVAEADLDRGVYR